MSFLLTGDDLYFGDSFFVLLNLQTDVYCHFCVFFFGDGDVEDSDEYSAEDCKDDSDKDCEDDSDEDS